MAPHPHLYVIAGEHSGDQLGGAFLKALREQQPFQLSGLGGEQMMAQGLQSLFPIEDIAVIGIAEIIPHIFRLKRRIREVAEDIRRKKPTIVVSIDSPGFTFRVIERLRKQGYNESKFVHYVAQTVWAYRPKRAIKAARMLDALMTLFAFEVPYFSAHGLNTTWVGHEAAWLAHPKDMSQVNTQQLVVFPGSRRNELKRHMPLFRDIAAQLSATHPSLTMVMPLPTDLHAYAHKLSNDWPCPLTLADATHRAEIMATSKLALCKSGTISLECALSHTPMVITYKAHPVSAWLVRRTLLTHFAGLPNILLGREAVPEFIQERATVENITRAFNALLDNPETYATQQHALKALRTMLLPSTTESPSTLAARFVAAMF